MAAGLMIFLQIIIALTGNYCFFNLLTIALCLLLIDDAFAFRMQASSCERGVAELRRSKYRIRTVSIVSLRRVIAVDCHVAD